MKNLVKILTLVMIALLLETCEKVYARYVLTKNFETTFLSYPFYFEVNLDKNNYTYKENGIDISLNIANYVDDLYNTFDTEYEIYLEPNDKFELSDNISGTIKGNSSISKQHNIKINSISGVDINSNEKVNIIVKSTKPYSKEIKIPITIKGSGGLYSFMENLADGKTDEEVDFTNADIVSGVYMNYETREKEYPVYYYRGDVQNNATYAGYCWKIVRTTETGGIKLVYNGEVNSSGECISTHDYLGSETFNDKITVDGEKYASPSQVGYKFDKMKEIKMIVPSRLNDTTGVLTIGTIFGHDVQYDDNLKKYTLVNTKTINDLDQAEDDIRGGNYGTGYHYTCLSHETSCEKVYYIYFNDYGNSSDSSATGLFGIQLDTGLNVTDSLNEMLYNSSNSVSSHAKSYLDEFFKGEGQDYKRAGGEPLVNHTTELDDVQWCNDRTIAGYHGWDIDADNHLSDNKYLHFAAFGRLVGDNGVPSSRPKLTCDGKNDAFTVDKANGNGNLDYPIGMLTADEAVLAGAIEGKVTNTYLKMVASKNQFFMTPYYISDDHIRMFALSTSGELSSSYASNTSAIRPAIALNSNALVIAGDGSTSKPYQIVFDK